VLFTLLLVPFATIVSFIGDAIAGERERHTLETLLASRISDRAILLGKVIVTVGYAWGIALAGLLLGAVVANLANGVGHGSWVFYHPMELFLEALILSLLVSLLATSAGVLISLRVATVRQAQQILIVGTMVFILGVLLIISLLPADLFAPLSYSQLLLIPIAVLAILDVVLLGLALVSFQRTRLILS
jgi:ABC-2 type transport system permease protein